MSRFHSHISSALKILKTYSGDKPLATHIRNFFAADKKFGSRDRRTIASLCYCYFRTGHAFRQEDMEKRILLGLFLSSDTTNELLRHFYPELDEKTGLCTQGKLNLLDTKETAIFPFEDELGKEIDPVVFSQSFLKQPAIFLRIRPGMQKSVEHKLVRASLNFEWLNEHCMRLENNTAADKVLQLNKEAVIQDINSQKVLDYLEKIPALRVAPKKINAWDCCAASGGKSILLYDKLERNVQITVSDIRESILANLSKRLEQAGINIQRSFIADLSVTAELPFDEKFSIILCDVPCTGSGTWGRSPEQLSLFKRKMIPVYAEKQQEIVLNTIPHLKKGGLFFYITCSVFKKENEEVVDFIKEKFSSSLQLMQMEYLKGYETAADTMFVAVFKLV